MSKMSKGLRVLAGSVIVAVMACGASFSFAQALSPQNERILTEVNQASYSAMNGVELRLRDAFRATRSRTNLKKFVDESLSMFEKLKQFQNMAMNPAANEVRIGTMFRQQIMDEGAVCALLERSLTDFCRKLDEQDQALLIRLKIDREAARTSRSRTMIDPTAFKQPIATAAQATVTAVKNDIARTVASFVASEGISAGVKRAARDFGVMPGERGSAADIVTGLLIDIGVGIAVDVATDPTGKMVSDLETRLANVERQILDGTTTSPGFMSKLRQITQDRAAARRKLVVAELSN
jgi:hypothetical protein